MTARHRVTSFFRNADELWQIGMISKRTVRAAVDKPGLAVLIPSARRWNGNWILESISDS